VYGVEVDRALCKCRGLAYDMAVTIFIRQYRTIPGTYFACRMFRHIVQKYSAIHKVFPAFFEQSDENSDSAIFAPELCGVAIMFDVCRL
jgi:hypothetical protein